MELIATGPQSPLWFLSHAWKTEYWQTLEMLDWHAKVHKLASDAAFWFCTMANVSLCWLCSLLSVKLQNQHDLSQLTGDLRETPFWRGSALRSCVGVLQLLAALCAPDRRIWCICEVRKSRPRVEFRLVLDWHLNHSDCC